ncbi:MAG: membrane dipeptidase [Nitrososphaerota archaeon]|jgi:membrane dipeptidase|nr:membrane dipeptidase [Nitrososphaerota archaeon]MDG6938080.1 membrane dipeptidase [Nitrososphaerota archaeon]MDG6952849.1 membrane dipeptidase [Nitrososphaerota archaeon]MDG6957945.1 membrane dipeptidase [Nitrososphaerota archaeon]MDG6959619.1 membrane dipeptidase [Nitrososphaerota archaeon]
MVVDLHEDIGYYYLMGGATPFSEDAPGRQADIPKYKKADMTLVLGSVFPLLGSLNLRKIAAMEEMYGHWSSSSALVSPRDVAIELIKIYYALEKMHPKDLKIVRTREDIESLGNRVGIVLHIEGCEALGEPEDLEVFFNLGVRSIGLTWNYDNKFAASCLSSKDYGLTGEGEALVALADKLGVMLDLSHASPRTSSDVLNAAALSPFFSHSDSAAVQSNRRNISDDLIRETGRRGGIVGLTFIRSCIGRPFTAARLVDHAKRFVRLGGPAAPALGTDFLGMSSAPEGMGDISRVGKFRKALVGAGVPTDQADGIMHGNAYRFILERSSRW